MERCTKLCKFVSIHPEFNDEDSALFVASPVCDRLARFILPSPYLCRSLSEFINKIFHFSVMTFYHGAELNIERQYFIEKSSSMPDASTKFWTIQNVMIQLKWTLCRVCANKNNNLFHHVTCQSKRRTTSNIEFVNTQLWKVTDFCTFRFHASIVSKKSSDFQMSLDRFILPKSLCFEIQESKKHCIL